MVCVYVFMHMYMRIRHICVYTYVTISLFLGCLAGVTMGDREGTCLGCTDVVTLCGPTSARRQGERRRSPRGDVRAVEKNDEGGDADGG
jgi:hypothetical protein